MGRSTRPRSLVSFSTTVGELELECMGELEAGLLPADLEQYFLTTLEWPRGGTLLDVGANVGGFSVAALQRAGGELQTYAVEPIPEIHAVLERNLRRHFGERGATRAVAVGRPPGRTRIQYHPHLTLLSSFRRGAGTEEEERARLTRTLRAMIAEGRAYAWLRALPADFVDPFLEGQVARALYAKTVEVPVETLSHVIRGCGLAEIDVLKVDVEGAELSVLESASPDDWSRIRQVVVEVEAIAERGQEVRGLLSSRGFEVQSVQDDVQRAGDFGLMVARPRSRP